ncbi:MAG: hypothetical protein M1833_006455 [Piccolia ochrophora]|nr:MAG: hypothetical protein M1833_006455 [Piccolia ochrophora]
MHILLVNDDGPPSNQSSPYVHSLVSTLQSAGHTVSIVLPHTQRSWIGKAHIVGSTVKPTYFRPGTLHNDDGTTHSRPLPASSDGEEWILIDGSPASCVQIGLHHFFKERGPVDLVLSGPNYGRNTTAVFGLSSGTLGGALEAAVCRKKAIALSYAFFSRNHDPSIIAGASRLSVKLVQHLYDNWTPGVDVYSINVPLVVDVENNKILYTHMLQNYWSSGLSSFEEIEPQGESDDPEAHEKDIRREEESVEKGEQDQDAGSRGPSGTVDTSRSRVQHKHFKWAPQFADVHKGVEASEPGNDGWAVRQGHTSVTPLKANFMHVQGLQGELKLSSGSSVTAPRKPRSGTIFALVDYEDVYVQPMILSALRKHLPGGAHTLISTMDDLPTPDSPILHISSYETLPFDHVLAHTTTSIANAYIIRKALIRKHYLSNTIHNWIVKHPDSILKDHFKPAVEFELDYAEFLDEALSEAYELRESFARNAARSAEHREWWILKPGMSDRGQGIRLFSTEEELCEIFEEWEADEPDAEDEADGINDDSHAPTDSPTPSTSDRIITSQLRHFIAQPYIHPPLLFLPANPHKFHIRTYVLALGGLQVFVHRDMLALFSTTPYTPPCSSSPHTLSAHLTNTCLQPHLPAAAAASVARFWTLPATLPASPDWREAVFAQICAVTAALFDAAARSAMVHFQTLPNAFEVFGVDFLVDAGGTAWVLEVNAFPDFKQTGEGLRGVVEGLWAEVVRVVVGRWFGGLKQDEGGEGKEGGMGLVKVLDVDLGRR